MGTSRQSETRETQPRFRESAGFTLIELLVYIALFVVVLGIVGGFLINSLRAEKTVRSSTDASSYGQLLSQSIQRGVRNASAIAITSPVDASKKIPAGSQLLAVEVLDGSTSAPVKKCQAWLYVPDLSSSPGGQIFVRPLSTSPVTRPDLRSAYPSSGRVVAPAGWNLYGEGVKAAKTTPFEAAASGTGRGVKFDFALTVSGSISVQLRGQEFSRQNPVGSTSSCF